MVSSPIELRGRRLECAVLDEMVAGARAGRSQVLVLRGEAGIGKTALLEELARRTSGCRIERACGVEPEMELAFAGLHQLCNPMLAELDHLPAPQRDALATAFGLSAGPAPDRFLTGLAVLSLLAHVAENRPLVCVVDDAQWLDRASAQALEFVARRLLADSVVLILAVRTDGADHSFGGLPELVLEGLGDEDARALLRATFPGAMDDAVREQIIADSRGNPLALLEAHHGLTSVEFAGGFGLPHMQPMPCYIEDAFLKRLESLPADTRRFMLAAAVDSVGDVSLLWRAADRLGIGVDAATPAESAGLLELGIRVRFRHPLVRSAVCRMGSKQELREVHRALAEATDPELDADRRAWHLAHAASGPDEAVADELERSAGRAGARGGVSAAAAFLKRATELTPDPARRGRRALTAARSAMGAGAAQGALDMIATAAMCPLDDVQRARLERLRAECAAFTLDRRSEAPVLLLRAAAQLAPLDAGQARETYLEALCAAHFAGRLTGETGPRDIAEAAGAMPATQSAPAHGLLLDGLVTRFTEGYPVGAPLLKRALEAFRGPDLPPEEGLRWLSLASTVSLDLWDDEAAMALTERHLGLARGAGSPALLPLPLDARIVVHLFAGELAAAGSLVDEMKSIDEVTGRHLPAYGALLVAAWRGDGPAADEWAAATVQDVVSSGEGFGLSVVEWAMAMLAIGAGRYEDALVSARALSGCVQELAMPTWALVEVVEASSRVGLPEEAMAALRRLTETTAAAGTDWAGGVEARSRALITTGEEAEEFYLEAIKRLGCTRVRTELARSHLVYGEWLRPQGRRVDARLQLRTAHQMFSGMGAEGFAERARRELMAMGENVRKRAVQSPTQLTAQEAQIARLVGENLTNPEIGAQLFLSARTVEWHLRKVFSKLGVSSRKEVRARLREARLVSSA
jgi:DNA-binding CsgD family transcriptional regulator